ncbi:hypothetical protein [Saccharothrix sp.]|uniref:hypothetical protein n=1 Tax=Saccharothrix sp. TaxID=1873460 RepID=UPI0028118F4E|nr:hypothetical protein [Saccharothrix sp.]
MTSPEGRYTDVNVVPIQGGRGSLIGGTGTMSSFFMFSAGEFTVGDQPEVGEYYNISGVHNGQRYGFPRWKCTHSGGTSDFSEG